MNSSDESTNWPAMRLELGLIAWGAVLGIVTQCVELSPGASLTAAIVTAAPGFVALYLQHRRFRKSHP